MPTSVHVFFAVCTAAFPNPSSPCAFSAGARPQLLQQREVVQSLMEKEQQQQTVYNRFKTRQLLNIL